MNDGLREDEPSHGDKNSNQTTVYLAGDDSGAWSWKTELQDSPLYSKCGVNFLTSTNDAQQNDVDGVLTRYDRRSWTTSKDSETYDDRDVALAYLLDDLDHSPMPFTTWDDNDDVALGIEGPTPLKAVLGVFDKQHFGTSVSSEHVRESADHRGDVDQTLTLLESVNIVESDGRGEYQLVDKPKTHELIDSGM